MRLEETLQAYDDLVRQGKTMYIGVSEWTAGQISEALTIVDEMGFDRIISSQPQYSMLWRVPEAEVIPLCRAKASARSCGPHLPWACSPGSTSLVRTVPRARGTHGSGIREAYLTDEVLTAVQNLRPIADDLGVSMANLALAWVLSNDNVSAVITGATKPEQVRENVKASGVKLDAEVLRRIDEVMGDLPQKDPSLTGGA